MATFYGACAHRHFTKKYVLKKKTSFALQCRNCSLLQVRMDAWVVVVARTVGIVVASYNRDPRFESIYHQSYLLSTVLKRRQNKKRGAQLFKKSECSNDHDQCDLIGHFLKVLINKFWKKSSQKVWRHWSKIVMANFLATFGKKLGCIDFSWNVPWRSNTFF